jgi:hypothetical protein
MVFHADGGQGWWRIRMFRKAKDIEMLQRIHVDELPERCRVNIRQYVLRASRGDIENSLDASCRIPGNCIVLAHKSKGKTRYPKWQVSFLPEAEIPHFKQSNPDYQQRYYRVWGDIF